MTSDLSPFSKFSKKAKMINVGTYDCVSHIPQMTEKSWVRNARISSWYEAGSSQKWWPMLKTSVEWCCWTNSRWQQWAILVGIILRRWQHFNSVFFLIYGDLLDPPKNVSILQFENIFSRFLTSIPGHLNEGEVEKILFFFFYILLIFFCMRLDWWLFDLYRWRI